MLRIKNKYLRIFLLCVLVLVLGFITLIGTCRGLGWLMYKQRGCGAFQIDNMELHTRTDIPDIYDIDCDYNSTQKLKRVYFTIKKKQVQMTRYISFSEFVPLQSAGDFNMDHFFRLHADSLEGRDMHHLFYKEHTKADGEYYKALLDTSTGQVWLNLQYTD
jgi:hypothetical protein